MSVVAKCNTYPLVEVTEGGVSRFVAWPEAARVIAGQAMLGTLVEESDGTKRTLTTIEHQALSAESEDWMDS